MEGQRKYAILFAATILAARKLNESGSTPILLGPVIASVMAGTFSIRIRCAKRFLNQGNVCIKTST